VPSAVSHSAAVASGALWQGESAALPSPTWKSIWSCWAKPQLLWGRS